MDQFNFSADVLVDRLRELADGKTEVAMLDEFNRLTLDVIAKVHTGGLRRGEGDSRCPVQMHSKGRRSRE